MVNCGNLLKSALVATVLMAMIHSGSAAEKLATCCRTVNKQRITEPITGYMVQKASPPCVPAVIFQTEKGLFCSHVNAYWVRSKIIAFEKAKVRATPSSTVSLLSIITSTASPPSSSTPFPSSSLSSSPPTSEMPAGEGTMSRPASSPPPANENED